MEQKDQATRTKVTVEKPLCEQIIDRLYNTSANFYTHSVKREIT
jgi:hypothetical protein